MGKRILLVDDAAFMRIVMKDALTKNGYEVCGEAENGAVALERYKELAPDLVIMDITMPDVNGIDALRAIRILDKNAVVIMCSAMGQQSMVIEAIKEGARDFVVKPFEQTRLIEAVKKAIG